MSTVERITLEPAWVLHHYPYRDTSLLLEVFTRSHGRVGLVARGARSPKSQWYSRLQVLRPLLLSWSSRGELGTLSGAEARDGAAPDIGRHLLNISYLNELLLRLVRRNDPHPQLFASYETAVGRLTGDVDSTMRYFEKDLLQELGYGLQLEYETDSGTLIDAAALYEYRLEQGPVRCRQRRQHGIHIQGATLQALAGETLEDRRHCREARTLTQAALAVYLGDRPLKSREVLRQLSRLARSRVVPPHDSNRVTA